MLGARHAGPRPGRAETVSGNIAPASSQMSRLGCMRRACLPTAGHPLHSRCLPWRPLQNRRQPHMHTLAAASSSSAGGSPDADKGGTHKANWRKGWQLAAEAAGLFRKNFWSILALFVACDAAIFVMHRICHRLINEVALRFLLEPQLRSVEALGGSLWWLSGNVDIANFQTGYQWLALLGFLVMFPVSVLLRTFATASTMLIAAESLSQEGEQKPRWLPPVRQITAQLRRHGSTVRQILTRLWQVDLLVAVRAVPLQGMCLLLVPIPWVLPWLLNLQLALPLSMYEGEHGDDAVKASQRTVEPVRGALAFPYVGLLLLSKALAFLGRVFLTQLSPRVAREVPEIPIAVYLGVGAATLVFSRIQDLLPLVTYIEAKRAYGFEAELQVAK